MHKPLMIDLYAGLGGWAEGGLTEGFNVVGFDIERHIYGSAKYPAQLVLQDVLTLHGSQFKDAALIVASPPCQAYSYRAMPWKRAKALPPPDNTLFEACFRIQREASEAAGRHIPLIVENVRGAQKWVGKAKWHYGSFYLWGDVPALMPITSRAKVGGITWTGPKGYGSPGYVAKAFTVTAEQRLRDEGITAGVRNKGRSVGEHKWDTSFDKAIKNNGGSWFAVAHNTTSGHGQNPDGRKVPSEEGRRTDIGKGARFTSRDCGVEAEGIKQGGDWFNASQPSISRMCSSKSSARKAASAHIAKIPFPLARWVAKCYYPSDEINSSPTRRPIQ